MKFFVTKTHQSKAQKSARFFYALINLFLIILVVSGCIPQVSVDRTPTRPSDGTPANIPVEKSSTPTPPPTDTQAPPVSLTFIADEDAYARQSEPDTNFGGKSSLRVDTGSDSSESFLRFVVKDLSGSVQKAILRLYTAGNNSNDGPVIYATSDTWTESELTWNNRPEHTGSALDNKDKIDKESWVEYDVTRAVTGNGTFSFALIADSGDAVAFSSRESDNLPELVVTFIPGAAPAATPTQSAEDIVFVGAGDISMCSNDNDELTAELLDSIPGTVFTTGDNAYSVGSIQQFMDCYDPTWGRHKDRTYPIPGNHDYDTQDASGYYQYFNNIEPYYAYNLGNWRIYALNSEIGVEEDSKQVAWLKADLAENPRQCVLAYWHRPRWSSGSTHGNSRRMQTFWKIFYDAGAELVLNGHEHSYERFKPMDAEGLADPQGLREFVVGTGGGSLYQFGPALPTTEVRNNTTYGVLKLTLHANSYDWEFIPVGGSTFTDRGSTECH